MYKIIDNTMLNNNAHQKPSTLNPGTIAETSKMMAALMTKVNNPSVRILMGKVRINRMGLMTALISPRTSATISAVRNRKR